jgi:hypothetical protein
MQRPKSAQQHVQGSTDHCQKLGQGPNQLMLWAGAQTVTLPLNNMLDYCSTLHWQPHDATCPPQLDSQVRDNQQAHSIMCTVFAGSVPRA